MVKHAYWLTSYGTIEETMPVCQGLMVLAWRMVLAAHYAGAVPARQRHAL